MSKFLLNIILDATRNLTPGQFDKCLGPTCICLMPEQYNNTTGIMMLTYIQYSRITALSDDLDIFVMTWEHCRILCYFSFRERVRKCQKQTCMVNVIITSMNETKFTFSTECSSIPQPRRHPFDNCVRFI